MSADLLKKYAVGGAARPDALTGLQPQLGSALATMFAAAPPEIQGRLRIGSGFRSNERQGELYNAAVTKYGSPEAARKWVAPPGRSQHNHGGAADLSYLDPSAMQWAHANAPKYGLSFPLPHENWHVELAGARDGHQHDATTTLASASNPSAPPGAAPSMPGSPLAQAGAPFTGSGGTTLADAFASAIPMLAQAPQRDAEARAAKQARLQAMFGPGGVADAFA